VRLSQNDERMARRTTTQNTAERGGGDEKRLEANGDEVWYNVFSNLFKWNNEVGYLWPKSERHHIMTDV
jgi:hypothetical protein